MGCISEANDSMPMTNEEASPAEEILSTQESPDYGDDVPKDGEDAPQDGEDAPEDGEDERLNESLLAGMEACWGDMPPAFGDALAETTPVVSEDNAAAIIRSKGNGHGRARATRPNGADTEAAEANGAEVADVNNAEAAEAETTSAAVKRTAAETNDAGAATAPAKKRR